MSIAELAPHAVAAPPRVCVICFGLDVAHIRKQPWHSAWGIASGLQRNGFEVCVITDARQLPPAADIQVESIDSLYEHNAPSPQLRALLRRLAPARVIAVIGVQELMHPQRFALGVPVTLLLANQRFRVRELLRLGWSEWRREWPLLRMPLVQSLLPPALLRAGLRKAGAAHLMYLSTAAQKRHAACGLPPGSVIAPRVAQEFLVQPQAQHSESIKTFCHFGSPLFLRGVKNVIEAFISACEQGVQARLQLLLRVDDEYTVQRAAELKALIEQKAGPYRQWIECCDDRLSAAQLAEKLASADIFVLPFKLTVSDVPLVIIEAAMSGKPVIAFDTPGVTEWGAAFPNIVISGPRNLSVAMQRAIASEIPRLAADFARWSDWQLAVAPLARALRRPIDCAPLLRYRMIGLIGIDGCGKSTLLAQLSEQMGLQGYAHGYIWSRFRNYVSKPFLALMRLTGHNRKVEINGIRIGLHEFAGHPLLARVFLFLQQCDMWLDINLRYKPRLARERILGDRCPLDTLVDLAIDTGMDDVIFGHYGRKVFASLPQPSLLVMVVRDAEQSQKDRPDIAADPHYRRRLELYAKLAKAFDLPILHNDGTLEECLRELCRIAESSKHAEFAARI